MNPTAGNPALRVASIDNAKKVTADDILAEANAIWKEAQVIWRRDKVEVGDMKRLDQIYNSFWEKHKDLFSTYPTVMRHMLQEKQYHVDAFRKYLRKVAAKPWTNDEQRMDSYADYAVILYKTLNSRENGGHGWNAAAAGALHQDYRQRLQREHDEFRTKYEKHRREVEAEEKRLDIEKRQETMELIKKIAAELGITQTETLDKMSNDQLDKVAVALGDINNKQ